MKNIIIVIGIVAVAAAIFLGVYSYVKCEGCGKSQTKAHIYLIDTSDSLLINYPDPVGIADNLYSPGDYIFNGVYLKLRTIAASNYAQGHVLHLKEASALTSNELERIDEMNQFFMDITTSVELILNETNGSNYSSILSPFVQELKMLRDQEADEKKLFLYSDLKENTKDMGLNLYDKKTISELHINPSKIGEKIEAYVEFPEDLEGIEVHLIYSNKQYEAIRSFEAMAEIVKYLLEEKSGAKVTIHSQLKKEE